MSDVPAVPGGTDVELGYDPADTGLEDFEASDLVMPRLNIIHDEAVFQDNLTGEKFSSLDVVILGLIKQRILWDTDVNEGDSPLCKSYDFKHGHPYMKEFPWAASGFDPNNFDPKDPVLPCAGCPLKEWGSHPQRDTPWCSEQHTLPVMQRIGDGFAPALLTLQRSSIKPSRAYISAFARNNTPLFTVGTTISLTAQRKGTVNYAVPQFVKGPETDKATWGLFAQNYRQIRDFVTARPKPKDDSPAAPPAAAAPAAAPAPAATPSSGVPTAPPAPAASDDLPF